MSYRYFIKLQYKGKNYYGWQIQKTGQTIQQILNSVLSRILNADIKTTGAGRTDAGVHASEFFAHFDYEVEHKLSQIKTSVKALNSYLPPDIAILDLFRVNNKAHARFDALSRTYKYYITLQKNPFNSDYSYYFKGQLDFELLNKGAKALINYTDFTCFAKLHSGNKNNICKIYAAYWEKQDDNLIFTITADRFLRNMVRAIVGNLIDLGRAKITYNDFIKIIETKKQNNCFSSVPPAGLFLSQITYPQSITLL
ncbi:MAG: tRNA pseudouridine(38-40) synthase TruA [Bacteroidales bacterium]|nr:tRNA pseudouridine(38-40) synthase TruA [Bacteroidales bacterium]